MNFFKRNEDESTLEMVYIKYKRLMIRTAEKILGSEKGEEAVHDVFVCFIEKFRENYSELGNKPGQYFVVVVRNHALNIIKKERLEFLPLDEIGAYGVPYNYVSCPEEELIEKDSEERLVEHIQRLRADMQQLLMYRYIIGYSNQEIAIKMGVSSSVVSTRLDRARKCLSVVLNEGSDVNCYQKKG